jgi:hypothetical protein
MVEAVEGHEEFGRGLERGGRRLAGERPEDGGQGEESRPEKTTKAEPDHGLASCSTGEAEWRAVLQHSLIHLRTADTHPRSPLPRRLSPRSLPRSLR